jgi:hypothetical protein
MRMSDSVSTALFGGSSRVSASDFLLQPLSFSKKNISAGAQFTRTLTSVAEGDTVLWKFEVEAYDISFSAYFLPAAAESELVTMAEPQRHTEAFLNAVSGVYRVPGAGQVTLTWDNSFSWSRGKTVLYVAEMIPCASFTAAEQAAEEIAQLHEHNLIPEAGSRTRARAESEAQAAAASWMDYLALNSLSLADAYRWAQGPNEQQQQEQQEYKSSNMEQVGAAVGKQGDEQQSEEQPEEALAQTSAETSGMLAASAVPTPLLAVVTEPPLPSNNAALAIDGHMQPLSVEATCREQLLADTQLQLSRTRAKLSRVQARVKELEGQNSSKARIEGGVASAAVLGSGAADEGGSVGGDMGAEASGGASGGASGVESERASEADKLETERRLVQREKEELLRKIKKQQIQQQQLQQQVQQPQEQTIAPEDQPPTAVPLSTPLTMAKLQADARQVNMLICSLAAKLSQALAEKENLANLNARLKTRLQRATSPSDDEHFPVTVPPSA